MTAYLENKWVSEWVCVWGWVGQLTALSTLSVEMADFAGESDVEFNWFSVFLSLKLSRLLAPAVLFLGFPVGLPLLSSFAVVAIAEDPIFLRMFSSYDIIPLISRLISSATWYFSLLQETKILLFWICFCCWNTCFIFNLYYFCFQTCLELPT